MATTDLDLKIPFRQRCINSIRVLFRQLNFEEAITASALYGLVNDALNTALMAPDLRQDEVFFRTYVHTFAQTGDIIVNASPAFEINDLVSGMKLQYGIKQLQAGVESLGVKDYRINMGSDNSSLVQIRFPVWEIKGLEEVRP